MHPEKPFLLKHLYRPTFEMAVHSVFIKYESWTLHSLQVFFSIFFFGFGSGVNKQNSKLIQGQQLFKPLCLALVGMPIYL